MLHIPKVLDPLADFEKSTDRTGFYPWNTVAPLVENNEETGSNRGSLPFRITLARTEEQLAKAVALRVLTFGKRSLELASVLGTPEKADYSENAVVLIAESKESLDCLGTLRIVSNLRSPLDIESYPSFPTALAGRRIARAERLGVLPGRIGTLAKLALFKALHRYCLALQIDWIVVQATPPRDRDYRLLGFNPIMEEETFTSMLSPGKAQVCLALNAHQAERDFHDRGHYLYQFMIGTWHPDIDIFSSVQGAWVRPRNPLFDPPSPSCASDMPRTGKTQ